MRWLVTDHLGTPRIIVDKSGTLSGVSRHDYLPFGEELFANAGGRTPAQGYTNSDGVRQKFTQKERDTETGLDYFFARYYSSTQGRFSSADSLAGSRSDPQSLNLYTYTLNNPLKFVDPDGHWPQPFPINPIADLLGIGKPSEPMMEQGQGQKPVKIISGAPDSVTDDVGRSYDVTLVIKELGEATEPSGVPDWLRTVGNHFFKPAEFLSNRLPDGYTVTGSAFFVFSGHITVTSDLHVLGGLSTPNVGDIIRTGLAHTVLKPVPVSASFVATHIVGPTTTDQRDAFFGGNSFNVSGGYGAYGGVSVSGNRIGVSGGIGSPGIDIGVTRAWPLVNIPHPTFRQMQQRLDKFLTP